MLKAFRYRLSPTKPQAELINKHIGACRFIYNLALETKQMAYAGNKVNLTCFELMKQLPDLKKELPWLNEVNAQSLQQSIVNLESAYTSFFKYQTSYPKFKKKSARQSFRIPQRVFLQNDKLIIPKFQEGINIILHRSIKGIIKQATIVKTPTFKYFAIILCETGEALEPKVDIKENTTIGIDLGIKSYLVTSDGVKFDNPKFLRKAQSKLKFLNRKYSLYNGKRTKQSLVLLHEKIANQRKDFLDKTSMQLIKNHDSIAIEDLNTSGMLKFGNMAQSIADASWWSFIYMLEYKANWYGKNILKIGMFDPSSKTCSTCGTINKELDLDDRKWTCKFCETLHDRDVNAAINIKKFWS